MHHNDVNAVIQHTFGKREPELARVCSAIADYLRRQKSLESLHLTLSLLQRVTQAQSSVHLLSALQYLTGAQVRLLDIGFEFIDENGDYYPLGLQDVVLARQTNQLVRPDTGDLVSDFESSVLVYYSPSENARELLAVN